MGWKTGRMRDVSGVSPIGAVTIEPGQGRDASNFFLRGAMYCSTNKRYLLICSAALGRSLTTLKCPISGATKTGQGREPGNPVKKKKVGGKPLVFKPVDMLSCWRQNPCPAAKVGVLQVPVLSLISSLQCHVSGRWHVTTVLPHTATTPPKASVG